MEISAKGDYHGEGFAWTIYNLGALIDPTSKNLPEKHILNTSIKDSETQWNTDDGFWINLNKISRKSMVAVIYIIQQYFINTSKFQ